MHIQTLLALLAITGTSLAAPSSKYNGPPKYNPDDYDSLNIRVDCPNGFVSASGAVTVNMNTVGSSFAMSEAEFVSSCCPKDHGSLDQYPDAAGHLACFAKQDLDSSKATTKGQCNAGTVICKKFPNGCCAAGQNL